MSSTRQNHMVTITNDENYDLAGHMARLADSTNVVIPVANQTERDALTKSAGMTVARLDLGGAVTEMWDGSVWQSNSWTAYTPTLVGSTTNPSVGSGSVAGVYSVVGKSLFGMFTINWGAGSSVGSGSYQFGLPSGYTYSTLNAYVPVGTWGGYAAGPYISGFLRQAGGLNYVNGYWQTSSNTAAAVGSATFAWASGMNITGSFTVIIA